MGLLGFLFIKLTDKTFKNCAWLKIYFLQVPPSLTSFDISMAKLTYDKKSILSPISSDPVTCLIFIQTDREKYSEKEEGN